MRLNTGGGPVIEDDPGPTATERFGIFAATGIYGLPGLFGNNWGVADAAGNTDTGINVSTTASGAELRFTLQTAETYLMELKRLSDGALLFSHAGNLSATGAGPIDSLEITLFGNGSGNGQTGATMQRTGEREFYFNNLSIESSGNVILPPGDYNQDGSVDAADYVWWRKFDGTPEKYDEWRANFGSSATGGTAMASGVPEPSAVCLSIIALGYLLLGLRAQAA